MSTHYKKRIQVNEIEKEYTNTEELFKDYIGVIEAHTPCYFEIEMTIIPHGECKEKEEATYIYTFTGGTKKDDTKM